MSHASEPSMGVFWLLISIAAFGGLTFLWVLGKVYLETYREEKAR